MNSFYIDESGSMTKKNLRSFRNKYFVICILKPINEKELKKVFKRFISSNINRLKETDTEKKMFYSNGKFKELKGNSLTSNMKREFINYFCKNNLFELYYIYCENSKVKEYFYKNTSRSFNYLLKLGLEHFTKMKLIKKSTNHFFIDERNVRTDTKSALEEYLNTELVTAIDIQESFKIEYCQSESQELIQLADTFSNIFFSNLISKDCYKMEIEMMKKDGYIKDIFIFPLTK